MTPLLHTPVSAHAPKGLPPPRSAAQTPAKPSHWLVGAVLALALSACGGGGDADRTAVATPTVPTPLPGAGDLKSAVRLGAFETNELVTALAATGKQAEGVVPRYPVVNYRLDYLTSDADGQLVTASGLVSVPQRPLGQTSPVMGYQHGTTFVDAEAPSNSATAAELPVLLASLGYMVVAPDYVGYGASKGVPHPYLQAIPSAAAVVDMHTAVRTWQANTAFADNGQLFLVGYSEGAYATVAAQRAMTATGSSHLSRLQMAIVGAGPYNVQTAMDGVLRRVRDEEPVLGALLNPGFLRYLGSSVRDEVRRALLKQLVPADSDVALDSRFLDPYLADDEYQVDLLSNVHRWKPAHPVYLFHGKDDGTVTYGSSLSTLQGMQAQGAGDLVSLTDCTAQPSGHKECLLPFIEFMLKKIGSGK